MFRAQTYVIYIFIGSSSVWIFTEAIAANFTSNFLILSKVSSWNNRFVHWYTWLKPEVQIAFEYFESIDWTPNWTYLCWLFAQRSNSAKAYVMRKERTLLAWIVSTTSGWVWIWVAGYDIVLTCANLVHLAYNTASLNHRRADNEDKAYLVIVSHFSIFTVALNAKQLHAFTWLTF